MQKIDFVNGQAPALNEENLNLLQLYIEQAINAQVSGDTLPIGAILPYTGETAPANWLICDGAEISRTEYANLFAILGTTFGEGDGSTTFKLPNLKGKTIVGLNTSDTDFNEIGKTGGEKTHTLTISEMPKHNHNQSLSGSSNGNSNGKAAYNWTTPQNQYDYGGLDLAQQTGENQTHNNLQPYMVQNYIIKANQSAGLVATIVDSLESNSETNALSANQGKELNEKINTLTTQKNYFTEEQATGEKWIDGKMIYKKTIVITSLKANNMYNHGISNLNELVNITGSAHFTKQGWQPISRVVTDGNTTFGLGLGDVIKATFLMQIGTSYEGFTKAYVTIKYTKSTEQEAV